ncbi:MAG TPA: DinB family protein [Candidatus Sulfotelmatobacter sp.]|nr:DinB family protein [Candidatus Sulfotelmatobacter sp.]
MPGFDVTLATAVAGRYFTNLARIRELAAPLTEKQFWTKPFPYGNSCGHLVLHLTGNLNYYIGAQIANTGYTRDREREFTDSTPPAKEEALKRLDAAVAMAMETIRGQSLANWANAYSAVGTECKTRLDIVIQCAAHMQHHIGQMIYIANEWQRLPQP